MQEKYNLLGSTIGGILFIVIGVLFLFRVQALWVIIWILSIFALFSTSIIQIVDVFIKKKKEKKFISFLTIIANLVFAFVVAFVPNAFTRILYVILGWWILIVSLIDFINFIIHNRDGLKGVLYLFLKSVIGTIVAVFLIVRPLNEVFWVSILIGLYLIIYGAFITVNSIIDMFPNHTQAKINKHLSLSAPVLISAIIPFRFFFSINHMINDEHVSVDNNPFDDEKSDLEVCIYLKSNGPESLGHVDVNFEGTIYSYGLHDPTKRKLNGTLGDGVLIVADRNKFIDESINIDNKTVIVYKINISKEEKQIIRNRISELMSRSVEWKCPAALTKDNKDINDYASRVFKETDCKMYKFTKGKFKTYFVLSTNCVMIADYMIRCNELNLINMSGIITPGSYINFLNSELLRENGIVESRKIYRKKEYAD